MTTRQRLLGVVAILLVVLALAGIGATFAGWEPVGPPRITGDNPPYYVPDGDAEHTLDVGDFEVHGTHFRARLMTEAGGNFVDIGQHGGEGGRVAAPEGVPSEIHQGDLIVHIGNATSLTLRTYREASFGVWRTDPITLRFNATA